MDKKQFATFAMALKTYYPKENILPNDKAMELWFDQLQDIPYNIAEIGLKKWVSLNKWSPSIAEIRQMSAEISLGEIPDWSEAWDEVQRTIRQYGSYGADKAMESLSPLTRETTKRIGFTHLCMSENPISDRANFKIIYEGIVERKQKETQLSAPLRQLIAQVSQNLIEEVKE